MIVTGCVEAPVPRQFNRPGEQNYSCYKEYGGRIGYCNKEVDR